MAKKPLFLHHTRKKQHPTRVWSRMPPLASGTMPAMEPPNSLPAALQPLLQSHRYPGNVHQPVEVIETHISWVLLAGADAYKIKKPLQLPFLDFSTLALRQRYCDDELRLNQRFAPDIYLDVLPVRDTPKRGLQWGGSDSDGPVVEVAVHMRRFDETGRLDRVAARGALTAAHISDLAESVAAFHERAAINKEGFGSPAQVLAPAIDNFHELAQLLPPSSDIHGRLYALRNWTVAQHQSLAALMQARQQAGQVRECHGDLHLANMVLIDGRVRMFDCLEFNTELRWIDVANEIAFTYVDLLDHRQAGLANWFVDEVLSRSGDYEAARLLPFYAVYRAMVRAKVAAIRAGQQRPQQGRTASYDEALVCVAQAERLTAPQTSRLIITHGLAGCGKTYASNQLLQDSSNTDSDADHQTGARIVRLRSDVERRRLYGMQRNQRSGASINSGIYDASAHQRTYKHLQDTSRMLLRAGWSVIVDAAFLRRDERDDFHALADDCGAGFAILAPQADTDELRRRITARQAGGSDASEATLEVLDKQLQWIEPLCEDERPHVLP